MIIKRKIIIAIYDTSNLSFFFAVLLTVLGFFAATFKSLNERQRVLLLKSERFACPSVSEDLPKTFKRFYLYK